MFPLVKSKTNVFKATFPEMTLGPCRVEATVHPGTPFKEPVHLARNVLFSENHSTEFRIKGKTLVFPQSYHYATVVKERNGSIVLSLQNNTDTEYWPMMCNYWSKPWQLVFMQQGSVRLVNIQGMTRQKSGHLIVSANAKKGDRVMIVVSPTVTPRSITSILNAFTESNNVYVDVDDHIHSRVPIKCNCLPFRKSREDEWESSSFVVPVHTQSITALTEDYANLLSTFLNVGVYEEDQTVKTRHISITVPAGRRIDAEEIVETLGKEAEIDLDEAPLLCSATGLSSKTRSCRSFKQAISALPSLTNRYQCSNSHGRIHISAHGTRYKISGEAKNGEVDLHGIRAEAGMHVRMYNRDALVGFGVMSSTGVAYTVPVTFCFTEVEVWDPKSLYLVLKGDTGFRFGGQGVFDLVSTTTLPWRFDPLRPLETTVIVKTNETTQDPRRVILEPSLGMQRRFIELGDFSKCRHITSVTIETELDVLGDTPVLYVE